jgi:hypothetical protein
MRKLLLVACAAAAMVVAALPSASLASDASHSAPAVVHKCAPGNNDPQYCERCPDGMPFLTSTANAGAAAALRAGLALTGSSTSISFAVTPTACGTLHLVVEFGIPGPGRTLTFVTVALAVTTTTAGVPVTITAPLSTFGRQAIDHQIGKHDRLTLEIATTETSRVHFASKTLVARAPF